MASCTLAKNILKKDNCGYSLNKISDIYLANYGELEFEASNNQVSSITTAVTNAKVYHIEPSKDSASFEDVLNVTDSGAKYRTVTLNFSVDSAKLSAELNDAIDAIALGRYTAVAQLVNGVYIVLGRQGALEATSANLSGAASATEASAVQFVLVADSTETSMSLTSDAIAQLKALIAPEA